jgi:hypothetical protein
VDTTEAKDAAPVGSVSAVSAPVDTQATPKGGLRLHFRMPAAPDAGLVQPLSDASAPPSNRLILPAPEQPAAAASLPKIKLTHTHVPSPMSLHITLPAPEPHPPAVPKPEAPLAPIRITSVTMQPDIRLPAPASSVPKPEPAAQPVPAVSIKPEIHAVVKPEMPVSVKPEPVAARPSLVTLPPARPAPRPASSGPRPATTGQPLLFNTTSPVFGPDCCFLGDDRWALKPWQPQPLPELSPDATVDDGMFVVTLVKDEAKSLGLNVCEALMV